MPLFEYRCRDCHRESEILVRNREQPRCPACDSAHLEKLFSQTAAHATRASLPVASGCAPSGPPCSPTCCRLPQ